MLRDARHSGVSLDGIGEIASGTMPSALERGLNARMQDGLRPGGVAAESPKVAWGCSSQRASLYGHGTALDLRGQELRLFRTPRSAIPAIAPQRSLRLTLSLSAGVALRRRQFPQSGFEKLHRHP
jgi:hypothetical protein